MSLTVPTRAKLPPDLLQGRVALVTGGGRGIGAALAQALAGAGAAVGVCSRTGPESAAVARKIETGGGIAVWESADVTDEAQVERFVEKVVGALGGLDVVVCAAGYAKVGLLPELSAEDFRRHLEVNLTGVFLPLRASWPHLARSEHASVIVVASTAAFHAAAGWAGYCAAKYGLRGLMEALADEGRELGIRVNALCPGRTYTSMRLQLDPEAREEDMLHPDDLAATALYLASDLSAHVSGQSLQVRRL